MNTRKWLAECHAWLDDPESVQYFREGRLHEANEAINPVTRHDLNWRIKPKNLSINGREFECPVAESAKVQFLLSIDAHAGKPVTTFWHNTKEARDLHYQILIEESTPK